MQNCSSALGWRWSSSSGSSGGVDHRILVLPLELAAAGDDDDLLPFHGALLGV